MPAFLTTNQSMGSPSGSGYTIYDGVTDSFILNDVRAAATAADAFGISPTGLLFPWGTDTLEFGRFGYYNGAYIYTVVDATSAIIPDGGQTALGGPGVQRFSGYLGSRAVFLNYSSKLIRIFDAASGLWESIISVPFSFSYCVGNGNGSSNQIIGPDGRLWLINQSTRELFYYDGGDWVGTGGTTPGNRNYVSIWANDDVGPYIAHSDPTSNWWLRVSKWNGSSWDTILDDGVMIGQDTPWGTCGALLDGDKLALVTTAEPFIYSGDRDLIRGFLLLDLTQQNQVRADVRGIGYFEDPADVPAAINAYPFIWGASEDEFYCAMGSNESPTDIRLLKYDPGAAANTEAIIGARINGRGGWTGPSDARLDLGTWYQPATRYNVGFSPRGTPIGMTQTGDLEMTVAFPYAASTDDPADDPTSYALSSPDGVEVGVSGVAWNGARTELILTLDAYPTRGSTYTFSVVGNVKSSTGDDMIGTEASVEAETSLPTVTNVRATSRTTVEVTFSRPMSINSDLLDIARYSFSGGVSAVSVSVVSSTVVEVTTSEQAEDGLYALTVLDT